MVSEKCAAYNFLSKDVIITYNSYNILELGSTL